MTGGPGHDDDEPLPPGEAEPLEPVDLLPPSTAEDRAAGAVFGQRVERAIHRRLLGSSIADFCVLGPAVVVVGLAVAVVGYWHRGGHARGEREEREEEDDGR